MSSKKSYPTIPVPQYGSAHPTYPLMNQIHRSNYTPIGSIVLWTVDSKRRDAPKPFVAMGKVVKIYTTTFGSTVRKEAAQIETVGRYLEIFPGRKHTTVSMDKLKIMKNE